MGLADFTWVVLPLLTFIGVPVAFALGIWPTISAFWL